METIEKCINAANKREKIFIQWDNQGNMEIEEEVIMDENSQYFADDLLGNDFGKGTNQGLINVQSKAKDRFLPTVRLNVDITTIPPSSTKRHEFISLFSLDIAKVLRINADMIEVFSLKPASTMPWLTTVEFDIAIVLPATIAEDIDNSSNGKSIIFLTVIYT